MYASSEQGIEVHSLQMCFAAPRNSPPSVCLQVIQAAGAEPVATAGSSMKRALLRTLGVPCVVSSRDTLFTEELALQVSRADLVKV